LFFNRLHSFATLRNSARVERLSARPQKSKRPNQTQRDKRRGLKVSNAFFDGPPGLPDGRKNVLQTQRNTKSRNAFQRSSPPSSRRRQVPSETTTSRQTNRFSRVPSRPPLLLTPRLEATCGTKVSRVVASKSSRRPFFLSFRKSPCRRELQAPLPRFKRFSTFSNDDACGENRASAVGPSARRIGRSSAERGRRVEPKAVRNKGISRIEPTKRRCERPPSVDAKQSASRDNRGDARVKKRKSRFTNREQSRRRRSTRTAEPRVERRQIASRARVSPPPVPTRVSTIKYLAFKPTKKPGKFSHFRYSQKSPLSARPLFIPHFPHRPSLTAPRVKI